ncbi:hypothetical protein ACQUWZ_26645, partial [Ralstonia pseudosolanacearum]|uniref:hypothetical protein n=1 Tax=Ralstonia pseudosolanacearum TaxID=1310165 RepID=UPI003D17F70B
EAKKVLNDADADKEKFESAASELSNKIMPIGAKLYQQETPKSDNKSDDKKSSDDDAVEGEVVDKE